MLGKQVFRATCLLVCFAASVMAAQAAPPWAMLGGKAVDADPEKQYKLTESNGPWMILACSFNGEGAESQARDLAVELRKRYKLEAYIHKSRFDLGEAQWRGVNQFGERRKGKYLAGRAIEEYAVMVGNYQTVDDPEAQKVLQKLKFAHPQCLEQGEGKAGGEKKTNQSLAGWRALQKQAFEFLDTENKSRGPMNHAFVTTNPLLPPEHFNARGVDEFVLKMNRDVRYSLLDCPGKYSVQVAQFTGEVTIDPRKVREAASKEQDGSRLAEAGEKAEKLTEALRLKGYEAYCLHDRYASIVCVGSFDSVGSPRADGKIEINPQIFRIIETFKAETPNIPGMPGAMKAKQLVGIEFDTQPVPVQVPRRSVGAEYSRSMANAR